MYVKLFNLSWLDIYASRGNRSMWSQLLLERISKKCIGGKLFVFNVKLNLISKDTFVHFSFTNNLCTFEYNHLIGLGVEGRKVTSQMGKWKKRWRGRSIQMKKQGGAKVEIKRKNSTWRWWKGGIWRGRDDERHNRTKDDNYKVEH